MKLFLLSLLVLLVLLFLLFENKLEKYDSNIYPNYRWTIKKCLDKDCIKNETRKCISWCTEHSPSTINYNTVGSFIDNEIDHNNNLSNNQSNNLSNNLNDKFNQKINDYIDNNIENDCIIECALKGKYYALNLDKNNTHRNQWYSYGEDFIFY